MSAQVTKSVGINDKLTLWQAFCVGLQSVLAMNLYIFPLIFSMLMGFDMPTTITVVAATYLASGIASVIQSAWCIKYPLVQGMSFVPLGAIVAISHTQGINYAYGAIIVASIILVLIGYPAKLFGMFARKFITPLVAGTVITVLGFALMFINFKSLLHAAPDQLGVDLLLAIISAMVFLLCILLGHSHKGYASFFRIGSVVYALIIGTLVASFLGKADFSAVSNASWIAVPKFFPFGTPEFEPVSIITMVIMFLIVLVESSGTWFAISHIAGEPLTENHINKGVVGEGLGCLVGAMFGGAPVTSYGTNAGVVAVTRVYSRWGSVSAGIILVVLGLIPKLMGIVASIPSPVIAGVFAVLTVLIMLEGLKVVVRYPLNERNALILGLPILLTLGASMLPDDYLRSLPSFANYILSAVIAIAAIGAIILNIMLPKDDHSSSKDSSDAFHTA